MDPGQRRQLSRVRRRRAEDAIPGEGRPRVLFYEPDQPSKEGINQLVYPPPHKTVRSLHTRSALAQASTTLGAFTPPTASPVTRPG